MGSLGLFLAYQGCSHWRSQWYASLLPASLEVEKALYVEDTSGLREGCGVAVYKIQDGVLNRIRAEGLQGPAGWAKGQERPAYGDWKPTPITPSDGDVEHHSWLLGMGSGCATLPGEMQARIDAALASPGSFYATGHESGVIVMPGLGWVLFSHFG